MKKQKNLLVTGISLAILSGCGGGSSDSDSLDDASATRLKGTAATGAAIANQPVIAKCADGTGFLSSVVTDTDGEWSGDIGENALPCALKVNSPLLNSDLYSFASSFGTVNITPLTNLVVARAAATSPEDWFSRTDISLSQSQLDAATSSLTSALYSSGFDLPSGNPVTTDFDIGDDWDEVLDDLLASIENSGSFDGYSTLLTNFLEGNNTLPVYVDSDIDYDDDYSDIIQDLDGYTAGYDLTISTYVDETASPVVSFIEKTMKPNSKSEFCVDDLYDDLKDSSGAYTWELVSCSFSGNSGEIRTKTVINVNGFNSTINQRTTYVYSKR
ncbi:hypothetical protein [Oceanospirillum linum]|uniref:Lipoprotein n=1 Tax=Oceanospirillum linum TaxID=966 RepID=A0A1T1H7U9_OCELI|nr:hypothetical protein [Oceanospirillum linum]OOV85918.1 hypothetical protein BTA35_0216190 [Oceanospirillum linum]SEG51416.1 hypothetical protein SAMN04489856_1155 [Oleiphilus messinensis]SMP35552.1 hypothetical protein SAMN06264348_1134 [Oceanospirillum linum]